MDIASGAGGHLADVVALGERPHEVLPVLLDELRAAPTLMLIEDAQWADEATLDLLALVGRRISATRSLLLITFRDDELGIDHPLRQLLGSLVTAPGVNRIRLEPLTIDGVRQLAGERRIDPDELHRRTGGNPFFLTEVLADEGAEVPASVRDAVLARAARLDPDARRLLEAISIVPGSVSLRLLTALAGEHADHLEPCLTSGMLVAQPGGVAFRHELARVAVAGTIDPRRITSLHRLALDTLRADDADVARLAHHAEAAGDAAAVEDFGMAAAEAALRVGAHREAAAQFGRVLRAGRLGPQRRAEVLQRCGHENYLIDHFEDAVGHTAEAADLHRASGDLDALGRTLVALAGVQLCVGQHDDAELERAGGSSPDAPQRAGRRP